MSLKCPNCKSHTKPANTIAGVPSEFWLECTNCNAYINTYKPQPHQLSFHKDPKLYKMNAGGYGSGKTTVSRQEIYRHALITPGANILIGAKVTSQYEQTIKREIENDFPLGLVAKVNVQKSYIDLINGARIMFRPFDDPEKLRSLNLSMFVIVEASEIDADFFHQLKTRLRNDAAFNKTVDWRQGIIETNPGAGWIRTDVLMNSSEIYTYGSTLDQYPPSLTPDPNLSTHITSTDANKYLPPNFISELTINKPRWWVDKYVYGSFTYAEGLVYPAALKNVVEPFEIPLTWKRIVACDYGLADKFTFVAGAIDPAGVLYIYKNYATNNKNIEDLAKDYFEFVSDIPHGGLLTNPILDPKSGAKRDYNKKTLYDHFLDYGICFQPGHINLDARIFRVNTYFEAGKLKVFDTCEELINELKDYKFPERTLSDRYHSDKPIDKNNHSINALEWICMHLPANPAKLQYGAYHPGSLDNPMYKQEPLWQLSDNEPDDKVTVFSFNTFM